MMELVHETNNNVQRTYKTLGNVGGMEIKVRAPCLAKRGQGRQYF